MVRRTFRKVLVRKCQRVAEKLNDRHKHHRWVFVMDCTAILISWDNRDMSARPSNCSLGCPTDVDGFIDGQIRYSQHAFAHVSSCNPNLNRSWMISFGVFSYAQLFAIGPRSQIVHSTFEFIDPFIQQFHRTQNVVDIPLIHSVALLKFINQFQWSMKRPESTSSHATSRVWRGR